jgi:hypothetical protein
MSGAEDDQAALNFAVTAIKFFDEYSKARNELVDRLKVVRKQFDDGDGLWRQDLLDALLEYLQFGIPLPDGLDVPLMKLFGEEFEKEFERIRRAHPERRIDPPPSQKSMALSLLAAHVTLLKELGHAPTIGKALDSVAQVSGVSRSVIKNFRDNINRGLYPRYAKNYSAEVERGRKQGVAYVAKILGEIHNVGALVK